MLNLGVVARAFDGREQGVGLGSGVRIVRWRIPMNGGHLGGEVDLRLGHTWHLVERTLNAGDAGGTGHAAHGQLHRVVIGRGRFCAGRKRGNFGGRHGAHIGFTSQWRQYHPLKGTLP